MNFGIKIPLDARSFPLDSLSWRVKLKVTCAIIVDGTRVLCTQRGPKMPLPLQWEFPGGKIEPGESAEACIVREIREELNIDIHVVEMGIVAIHSLADGRELELISFVCNQTGGDLFLREHAAAEWLDVNEMATLQWAEADIQILDWWRENAARIFNTHFRNAD